MMNAIAEQLDYAIDRRYERWREAELPFYLRKELGELGAGDLTDRFYKHLHLGPEGVREKVGAGTNRMNIYTVRRIALALAGEIRSGGEEAKQRGVAIAFDSRILSRVFAEQAALVLAKNRVKVYLFEQARPTPELSFAVRFLHAAAGLMITAGHYPYDYNGVKLFSSDGAVMTPEYNQPVARRMEGIEEEVAIPLMDAEEAVRQRLLVLIGTEVDKAYHSKLADIIVRPTAFRAGRTRLRVIYTPLHGGGGQTPLALLKQMGYRDVESVPEQLQPDPLFPTIDEPDPTNPDCYRQALLLAERKQTDLIMATDPESQQLGAMARDKSGECRLLSANQLGSLLLEYLCTQKRANEPVCPAAFYKSLLTTELSSAIARRYGLHIVETPPGFRHIAARIAEEEQLGARTFFFAFDETGGCLPQAFVRDKDAMQTLLLTTEMAAFYKSRGLTLWDQLYKLYEAYGFYLEDHVSLSFPGLEGSQRLRNVMRKLRGEVPEKLSSLRIRSIYDSEEHGVKALDFSKEAANQELGANVIKYVFEDGAWCALQPTGAGTSLRLYYGARERSEVRCRRRLAAIRTALLYDMETIL
ncbi:phospho-sugar mutase [Paenibacillus sp. KS-LC4]|uniref:phospho-sugar mutase n=1 Tax=Paenibacillus sp. KS-LC4 TaxID=2979727 RepID=UPI0030CEC1C7